MPVCPRNRDFSRCDKNAQWVTSSSRSSRLFPTRSSPANTRQRSLHCAAFWFWLINHRRRDHQSSSNYTETELLLLLSPTNLLFDSQSSTLEARRRWRWMKITFDFNVQQLSYSITSLSQCLVDACTQFKQANERFDPPTTCFPLFFSFFSIFKKRKNGNWAEEIGSMELIGEWKLDSKLLSLHTQLIWLKQIVEISYRLASIICYLSARALLPLVCVSVRDFW